MLVVRANEPGRGGSDRRVPAEEARESIASAAALLVLGIGIASSVAGPGPAHGLHRRESQPARVHPRMHDIALAAAFLDTHRIALPTSRLRRLTMKATIRRILSLIVACASAIAAGTARADEPPPAPGPAAAPSGPSTLRLWQPSWPRFRTEEYVATAAATAGTIAIYFVVPSPTKPRWEGGILLDDSARDFMVAGSYIGRRRSALASDLLYVPYASMLISDALIAGGSARGGWDVAWQMAMMDAEALSIGMLLATSLEKGLARARPAYEPCQRDPGYASNCDSHMVESFPSGHTTNAATVAGLVCAHHLHLGLYDGGLGDALTCAGMIGSAGATAALRMGADRHYLSDVVVGYAIGFLAGWGIPSWLHYRPSTTVKLDRPGIRVGVLPWAAADAYGLQVVGWQ